MTTPQGGERRRPHHFNTVPPPAEDSQWVGLVGLIIVVGVIVGAILAYKHFGG